MTITIDHGLPNSPYFLIAQPKRSYDEPRGCNGETIVNLQFNKQIIKTAYFSCLQFDIREIQNYNAISLLAYGINAEKLKEELIKKYPELEKPGALVEYWILKRV
jgi:hypothetical protein